MYQKIFASLILSLVLVPVVAAETDAVAQETAPPATLEAAADAMPASCLTPAKTAAELPLGEESLTFQAVTSVCTATCWDGSQRTCQGTSCSATDSACPNQRGYCWSDAEGYKYCPTCCAGYLPCSKVDGMACYPNGSRTKCLDGSFCAPCFCSNGYWVCA